MSWSILYPDGTDPRNPPTGYGHAESAPRPGSGIHALRSRAKRAKDKAKYEANRRARSAFNAQNGREIPGTRVAQYHTELNALSQGTAT